MSKQMQDAYIVAATRSPVGKAPRGMFRNVRPDDLLAHVLKAALDQCKGIDLHAIDDVIVGCAMPEAEQGMNVARVALLLAGLPNTVSGLTINRFCSSGLEAVNLAAMKVRSGWEELVVAGGVEISGIVSHDVVEIAGGVAGTGTVSKKIVVAAAVSAVTGLEPHHVVVTPSGSLSTSIVPKKIVVATRCT